MVPPAPSEGPQPRQPTPGTPMAAPGQDGDDVDHYEVLRLPSGAEGAALTVEQIEKAYRTQSRLRHPDKRPDDPNATADFQTLAGSYKLLRDEPLRRQFDARLRGRREAAARAAATGVRRRRAVSDLEERERAFAAGGGPYVDPDELARREDKRKAADIDRELSELKARKNSRISGSASTSEMMISKMHAMLAFDVPRIHKQEDKGQSIPSNCRTLQCSDCLNRLEEDYDNNEGAEVIGYDAPDLSGGVEGVDYIIVYGSGKASGEEQA